MDPVEARNLFPITAKFIFMNHAGVSPMSERARAAVESVMEIATSRPAPDDWSRNHADDLREAIGRLVGAEPESIAITRSTAHAVSLLACGLDWQPGDNVVGARGEYPANVYPWMALKDRGVEYRMAEPVEGRVTPESVLALVDERTRVVALSHVEFWNGYRLDLDAIGSELDRRGVIFAVDAIQSAGALRIDLSELPVDYLSAGAYKWLMGPVGIGFCYCRPELLRNLRPALVGTGNMKRNKEYFDYDFDLVETGRRFEEASISVLDMVAFEAAVELFLEIGTEVVEKRVLGLARHLGEGLAEHGYELVEPWPREPREASGIVSFRKPGAPAQEILRDLNACHVVGRIHQDFVRLGTHFYNTEEEVERVLELLSPQRVES